MVPPSQPVLLRVTQPLVPRANKPITTADLIKRLTDLSNQLIDASQDNAAIKAQLERSIAPQLVDKNLLQHKDKGVKSYVAISIVEILRICAPDAPFNASQLKVRSPSSSCCAVWFAGRRADGRKSLNSFSSSSSFLNLVNKLTTRTQSISSKSSNKQNALSS